MIWVFFNSLSTIIAVVYIWTHDTVLSMGQRWESLFWLFEWLLLGFWILEVLCKNLLVKVCTFLEWGFEFFIILSERSVSPPPKVRTYVKGNMEDQVGVALWAVQKSLYLWTRDKHRAESKAEDRHCGLRIISGFAQGSVRTGKALSDVLDQSIHLKIRAGGGVLPCWRGQGSHCC